MERYRLIFAGAALVVVCAGVYPLLVRSSGVSEDQLQEVVFVDTQSGEPFLLRARSSPEVNPKTGERTLIPGLYCPSCNAWKAVGTMEMLQTHPKLRQCPKHRVPLLRDGPLPERPAEKDA